LGDTSRIASASEKQVPASKTFLCIATGNAVLRRRWLASTGKEIFRSVPAGFDRYVPRNVAVESVCCQGWNALERRRALPTPTPTGKRCAVSSSCVDDRSLEANDYGVAWASAFIRQRNAMRGSLGGSESGRRCSGLVKKRQLVGARRGAEWSKFTARRERSVSLS
jgi:hypothetical protein